MSRSAAYIIPILLTLLPATSAITTANRSSGITWTLPSNGASYGPGEIVIGQWDVTTGVIEAPTGQPAFQLCLSDDGKGGIGRTDPNEETCGEPVFPDIQRTAGSSYFISLAVPNVTSEQAYYLRMEIADGSGTTHSSESRSAIFLLSPSIMSSVPSGSDGIGGEGGPTDADPASTSNDPNTPSSPDTTSSTEPAQRHPLSESPPPDTSPPQYPISSPSAPAANHSLPSTPQSHPLAQPPSPPLNSNVTVSSAPAPATSVPSSPNLLVSHSSPPTAAFAVPLSLLGAILLAAGGLAIYHRRQLSAERAQELKGLGLELTKKDLGRESSLQNFSKSMSVSKGRSSRPDVEKALEMLGVALDDLSYGPPPPRPGEPGAYRRSPRPSTRRSPPLHALLRSNEIGTGAGIGRTTGSSRTVPASVFRTSPVPKADLWAKREVEVDQNNDDDGGTTHSVLPRYMRPSPQPQEQLNDLSLPGRVYTRSEAARSGIEAGRSDKPLPPPPGDAALYSAVAQVVERGRSSNMGSLD